MNVNHEVAAATRAATDNAATRRGFMLASGIAAGGAFGGWQRAFAAIQGVRPAPAKARSVIMIFNCGAPSHLDLWDPKPHAPDDVRGIFRPIDTRIPGLFVSELIPDLAARIDRLAVVRTVHHRHGGA